MPKDKVFGAPIPVAPEDMEWQSRGTCSFWPDPDLWFSEGTRQRREARAVCREQCVVRDKCLAYALANQEAYGVWGGHIFKSGKPVRDKLPLPRVRRPRAA